MNTKRPCELWPVMITPFTSDGKIDFDSLLRLIRWYEDRGATGLFAACQSSEIFFLSLEERVELVRFVVQHARIPVIASGHVSDNLADQIEELKCMHAAGAQALILITNRLAKQDDPPEVFMRNLRAMMDALPADVPLGFYECPYPYKRLISLEELKWCADSGRFHFMKDTCCNIETIRQRLKVIEGSPLKLFNANTTTLLDSLKAGAAGFSGVMMNFHPELYAWLARSWQEQPENARLVQDFLTVFSFIELQVYPVNAKYHLQTVEHVLTDTFTRTKPDTLLTVTGKDEVRQLAGAAKAVLETFCR